MNLDTLKRFPNQNLENRPTECVGETVADIIGNLSLQEMDAGFSYAAALRVNNSPPTTAGSNPYAGMLGAIIYGTLPTDKVPFDVNLMDELYEANWYNYTGTSKQTAELYAQNGILILKNYQDVVNCLKVGLPVSLSVRWHKSLFSPYPNGVLPAPSGQIFNHNVAVYEETSLGLRIKAWLGPEYGQGGYAFMPESVFNEVYFAAYAFNPKSWRWMSLASTGCFRPWLLPDILPQL